MLARVQREWASALGVPRLERVQIVATATSPLCGAGRFGVLVVGDCVTVVVPDEAVADVVREAVSDQPPAAALDRRTFEQAFEVFDVVGPAFLSYRLSAPPLGRPVSVEALSATGMLLDRVDDAGAAESGLGEVTSSVSIVRDSDRAVVAAAGWREWPSGMAHLSVLTHPEHRGRGLAKAVAADAAARAVAAGLLPQWRARWADSRAVARALGFVEVGGQLNFSVSGVPH